MTIGKVEKRATKRWPVGLPVECKLGGSVANGLVRDITQEGAFIAFDGERAQGGIKVTSKSALNQMLQVGDRFLLKFMKTTVMNERSVLATVCWQGISSEYGYQGFGVMFNTE